ncbi:MAG: DUF3124 domain-containing protein [Xenococcus sp. (in: cyanobacteria)]
MKNIRRKIHSILYLVIAILFTTGCEASEGENTAQELPPPVTESCSQYSPELNEGVALIAPESLNSSQIVRAQTVYVPFYSQIYEPQGFGQKLDLRGTLSIRNTSETAKIRITRVQYFNSSGKLVKKCLENKHLVLSPLATTEFGITRQDESGGSGANFIIEWESEKPVSDPVIEAIMITFSGTHAYSFTSSGRVIEELK